MNKRENYASPDRSLQDISILNTFTLIMSGLLKSWLNINAISYTTTYNIQYLFLSCSYTIPTELCLQMFWKAEIQPLFKPLNIGKHIFFF